MASGKLGGLQGFFDPDDAHDEWQRQQVQRNPRPRRPERCHNCRGDIEYQAEFQELTNPISSDPQSRVAMLARHDFRRFMFCSNQAMDCLPRQRFTTSWTTVTEDGFDVLVQSCPSRPIVIETHRNPLFLAHVHRHLVA